MRCENSSAPQAVPSAMDSADWKRTPSLSVSDELLIVKDLAGLNFFKKRMTDRFSSPSSDTATEKMLPICILDVPPARADPLHAKHQPVKCRERRCLFMDDFPAPRQKKGRLFGNASYELVARAGGQLAGTGG